MRCALCYGFLKDQAVLSLRTFDEELDAGALVKRMIEETPFLRERGATGGGHGMMAGAQIPLGPVKNEQETANTGKETRTIPRPGSAKEREKIDKELRNAFLDAIGASKRARRKLVKKTDH